MRNIVLMIYALFVSITCIGELETTYDLALEQHRERVEAERQKIEERHLNCPMCKGKSESVEQRPCAACKGLGMISTKNGQATISKPCVKCVGDGMKVIRKPCPKCCPYIEIDKVQQSNENKSEERSSAREAPKCSDCSGKGYHWKDSSCGACNGKGSIYIPPKKLINSWSNARYSQCSTCSGKGKRSLREKCKNCNGAGRLKQKIVSERKSQDIKEAAQSLQFDIVKWLMWSAEHGDVKSQYCLGVMYATGDGVQKSVIDSEKWLKMAAKKKYAFACNLLEQQEQFRLEVKQKQEALVKANEARERERIARVEREKMQAEAERQASEIRAKIERERREKEQREKEEQQKQERIRQLEEKMGIVSNLPKAVNAWKRIIYGKVALMECQFPPQNENYDFVYNPIRIIAMPNSWSTAYKQNTQDARVDNYLMIGTIVDAEEGVLDFYLMLCEAAQKAKLWRKTAEAQGEKSFRKEIPVSRTIQGYKVDHKIACKNPFDVPIQLRPIRFLFDISKVEGKVAYARKHKSVNSWFRSIGKDESLVYSIAIEIDSVCVIVIDMDSIDDFLKAVNPMGAVEALKKYDELYK